MAFDTLEHEIEKFGEVRHSGCVLKIEGERYVMYLARNITRSHSLLVAATDSARLIAHWEQFKSTYR